MFLAYQHSYCKTRTILVPCFTCQPETSFPTDEVPPWNAILVCNTSHPIFQIPKICCSILTAYCHFFPLRCPKKRAPIQHETASPLPQVFSKGQYVINTSLSWPSLHMPPLNSCKETSSLVKFIKSSLPLRETSIAPPPLFCPLARI